MTDSWDLVYIGCGASKRATRCAAGELYTGPVFGAHAEIASHLGLVEPDILSARHGVLRWAQEVDPYEATLDAAAARRLAAGVLAEIGALLARPQRWPAGPATVDGCWPRRSRKCTGGELLWCGCAWPCRERHGDAFGPRQQPAVLVLAGAPYVDCWAEQARELGVRVDDPLRGLTLGERRVLAARFCAETPSWRDIELDNRDEHPDGWGSQRQQLEAFVAEMELERAEPLELGSEQLDLSFYGEVRA